MHCLGNLKSKLSLCKAASCSSAAQRNTIKPLLYLPSSTIILRTMSINTRVGLCLHDLNGGLLSQELRLHVPKLRRSISPKTRSFSTTRPRRALPLIPAIAAALKSSTALGVLGTTFRVAMTLVPAFLIRGKVLNAWLRKSNKYFPEWTEKRAKLARHLLYNRYALKVLFTIPTVLLIATLLASVERAPLTGRWRFILVSPKEEDDIIRSLSTSWRAAVNSVLASTLESGIPPPPLPASDWRTQWVEQTLRRLENAVPLLQADPASLLDLNKDYPYPPPSAYPLSPRPRPAHVLHSWAEHAQFDGQAEQPLPLIGPPYSCLVVEKPDSQNAFSYGFGPNGAGGVVVYTGFLDEILKGCPIESPRTTPMPSFWSRMFGTFLVPSRGAPLPVKYAPDEKHTAELAVLLAHELAHLLLAHHLESLSSSSILYPSVMSIFTDVARTVLFPATMLLGPFVNDALGQLSKKQSGEMGRLSEMCNGRTLEIEADIVSTRLLAYAGFDPRAAVRFWESRINADINVECAIEGKTRDRSGVSFAMGGDIHPLNHERVRRLKDELARWERDWGKLGVVLPRPENA